MSQDKKPTKKPARTNSLKTHAFSTPRRLSVSNTRDDMAYRHVRKDDDSVGMREQMGWEICKDEEIKFGRKSNSGTKETHDLILMEIPKSKHAELKKIPGLKSKRNIRASFNEGGETGYDEKNTVKTDKLLQNTPNQDNIFEEQQ